MEKDLIRQGDLLFIPIAKDQRKYYDKYTPGTDKYYGYRKDGIIQEGEATGHHHKLEKPESAEVYRPQNQSAIVKVGKEVAVVLHEEHKPVRLQPDTDYIVQVAREEDPTGMIRQVVD